MALQMMGLVTEIHGEGKKNAPFYVWMPRADELLN
jgi:hypothetical protein